LVRGQTNFSGRELNAKRQRAQDAQSRGHNLRADAIAFEN
jgi:hypothetical protein